MATKNESETVRTTIRLPRELHEATDACAEAAGISFNTAVIDALNEFVSDKKRRARVERYFEEGPERYRTLLDKIAK